MLHCLDIVNIDIIEITYLYLYDYLLLILVFQHFFFCIRNKTSIQNNSN